MAAILVPQFDWRADAPDGDRHAFPQREDVGFPFPALCGIRWTVRFGEHGARYCDPCLARLKAILSGATEALNEAEFTNATGDLDALAASDVETRPCPSCGVTLTPDETHWSLFPGIMGGYVCPVVNDSPGGAGHAVEADRG